MNVLNGFPGSRRWLALMSASRLPIRVFGYIFAILVGGLAFALLSDGLSFLASLIWKSTNHITIRQYAWSAGAIVSAVGIPLGWVKVGFFRPPAKKIHPSSTKPFDVIPTPIPQPKPADPREVQGFWPSLGFFAILGMILGIVVAMLLMMSWFSLSASPFAPAAWSESIQQSAGESGHGIEDTAGVRWSSTHPVLISLMWVPVMVMTTLGVAAGIVYGGVSWKRANR